MREKIYYETDVAKVTITFANKSKEEQEKIFKDIAQASYNLCLHEYKRGLEKTNEDTKGFTI